MQTTIDRTNTFHTYTSIFLLVLMAVLIGYLFRNLMIPRKDFYNELWAPAYLLVHGQSPYDTAGLDAVLPAAWFPMAIGFFFPLGWFSEENALRVWYVFNIVEICLVVYFVQGKNRNLYNTAALTLMCFFFPLTLNHFNYGQFSITSVLCWILAVYFWSRDRFWISALFIALALSKLHLGSLAMLGLSYHEYLRGRLRAMFSLWAQVLAMCLLLCLPLFVAYPNWIPDAILSMGSNSPWSFPSLYILFERLFDVWGRVLWGVTTLIVIAANFWLWKRLPIKNAVNWSLALAPLVTPYVGSWDFVVLLPLLIYTYANTNWGRKVFLWLSYCMAWVLMARIQMLEESHNHYFWWVPLWFISSIVLVTDWKVKPEE